MFKIEDHLQFGLSLCHCLSACYKVRAFQSVDYQFSDHIDSGFSVPEIATFVSNFHREKQEFQEWN